MQVDKTARTMVQAIVDMASLQDRSRECRVASAVIRTAVIPYLNRSQRFARLGKGYHSWLTACTDKCHGIDLKRVARTLKL